MIGYQGGALALAPAADPGAPALIGPDRSLSYRELRTTVDERIEHLGIGGLRARSVVLLQGPPSVEWVTAYLAIVASGRVPLLAGDHAEAIADRWSPAASIATADGLDVVTFAPHDRPAPTVHPELALLMSTSGSTGSPKLVRLSRTNVESNALAIAASLELTSADVGISSLPLHYCYGLSVLHSHLAVGASVSLVHASVVDPCFLRAMEDHHVTSLAGVPHTFDLLEAAGAERIATPWLRRLTQAGGRLDGGARRRWRARTEAWGIDFVVMYGQTEATARMAYLPPALLEGASPVSVGVPIPGGSLRVEPVEGADDGVGELVYSGPNVMMGYGIEPADLERGPEVDELRTGDLGRFDVGSGTFEVVGRASRFTKPFGLRIDLDEVEQQLRPRLGVVAVGGTDDVLVVVAPDATVDEAVAAAAEVTGLPAGAVVARQQAIARTSSGKVDQAVIAAIGAAAIGARESAAVDGSVPAVLATLLGVPALAPTDTFVSAGGDSLTYVEATVRLERMLGSVPEDWQHVPIGQLDAHDHRPTRRRIDTTILLRAVGILTVVATHMKVAYVPGGAHLLLAVVGYNFSRFHLGIEQTAHRLRATVRSLGRMAIPASAIALVVVATTDRYGWTSVGLVNNYLGPDSHRMDHWHYWFIEATVQLCLLAAVLLAVPAVRRRERDAPFAFAIVVLGGAVLLRAVTWAGLDDPANLRFRTHGVAAFFVLGWLVQRADTVERRVVASLATIVVISGFFDRPARDAYVIGGVLLLVWLRQVPTSRAVTLAAATLASASMWIYLSHFHIWPVLEQAAPLAIAYPATLLAGIAIWWAVDRLGRTLRRRPTAVVPAGSVPTEVAAPASLSG